MFLLCVCRRHSPAHVQTATSKHAVLGLLRSLHPNLHPKLPIRINAIGPSWTATGLTPKEFLAGLGEGNYQSADVVARSVTVLMADKERHGELIFSDRGSFMDVENGEKGFHALLMKMLQPDTMDSLSEFEKIARQREAEKLVADSMASSNK